MTPCSDACFVYYFYILKPPYRTVRMEEPAVKENASFKDTKPSKIDYREALEQQIQEKKNNRYATKRNRTSSNQDTDRVGKELGITSSRSRVLNQEEYREALNRQMEEKKMGGSRRNFDEPAPTSLPLPSLQRQGRPGMKVPKVKTEKIVVVRVIVV